MAVHYAAHIGIAPSSCDRILSKIQKYHYHGYALSPHTSAVHFVRFLSLHAFVSMPCPAFPHVHSKTVLEQAYRGAPTSWLHISSRSVCITIFSCQFCCNTNLYRQLSCCGMTADHKNAGNTHPAVCDAHAALSFCPTPRPLYMIKV